MSLQDYHFEFRYSDDDDWRTCPVTWISTDDKTTRAAVESLKGARALVALRNSELGCEQYRVVKR
jgi:hypothetical protein